jgi:hypothetical protein
VWQEIYQFDPRIWYHSGELTPAISANQISVLNHVKGTSLEEIRIV